MEEPDLSAENVIAKPPTAQCKTPLTFALWNSFQLDDVIASGTVLRIVCQDLNGAGIERARSR